ncbi:hypothetical protein I302_100315 [Kwoniella bestiolae CBS 10118]|uniref:WH1 domain-containing protein n=1 Tax=Kwoniella bestiolae CBS 10118 TaxID=1296100 RepID=A0A1B9G4T8_9TREE|nr:hypothetical protein I302_03687 [Kwoniella bestiolae CBS 10118]OCF26010.1 hypothetical protein I302_03687 [Kwoniella bestiolae CBS 10118]
MSNPSPLSDEEQQLLEYRNATNFRSVKRADPSVAQILDTSVYSVIYHYDEVGAKWEKQKSEGPLFVVQRDKSPEWSLYMLNRQGLKNPAIPLIPGEMKLTVIDQGMLQVARRGEKQRIGIWFSEGPEAVDRFRRTVLGICGEPSKRPDLPSSPANSAAQPVSQNEDGLSRLFAGLMKSPPVQSPPVQPAVPTPSTQTTTITTTTVSTTSQPILTATPAPPPTGPIPVPTPADPTSTHAHLPISPPPPPGPVQSPPGQTADDLLMSILGLAPPQQSQPHQHPQPQQQSPLGIPQGPPQHISPAPYPPAPEVHQQPIQQFPPPQYPPPQFAHGRPTPPPVPGHPQFVPSPYAQAPAPQPQSPVRYHKIGDATFARTAALASSSPSTSTSNVSPAISFHTPGSNTPNLNGYKSNHESRGIIAESFVDGIQRREQEGLRVAGIGLGKEERKVEFRRRVTDLILSDESFVDELWESYLDRMSRAAQGG